MASDEDRPATKPLDEGFTRRLKALACTAPLHDLDSRKVMLEWVDAAVYQMAEIAMHIIDQVTLAMDFDSGADHRYVVNRVRPFVAAQAPQRKGDEHERVARWVLDNLINVGTVDRGFRRIYGEVDVGGAYHRRAFDFKLIVELAASDGGIYLRATDEAINVLVGALDTDVESAQIAAEVKLESLISRGRLADAKLAAEQARYRTVQYGEMLRVRLDATRRDVRTVDWEREVPELVDSALSHIEDRFRTENAILRHITDARDEAEDPDHKRRAAELIEIVGDCIERHTTLLGRLQTAGSIFRAEQDRQQFSGTPQRAAVDLFGQLLNPVIGLSIEDAVAPLQAFFQGASGVSAPSAPSLPALVALLLRPAPEREQFVGEVPQPELQPAQDAGRYTEEHWRLADELLDLSGTTRDLSDLLADARRVDPDLPRLVALRAVHAYSPGIGAAIRRKSRTVLLAVPRGRELDPQLSQPFRGDDLLLTSAVVFDGVHIVESGEEGVGA